MRSSNSWGEEEESNKGTEWKDAHQEEDETKGILVR